MKFSTSEVYNAAIISFKGKLRGGPDAQQFQNQVADFIESGKKNIVINMQDVSFVDSSGLGNIVRAFSTVKDAGGSLKIAELSDKIQGLLSITKLDSVMEKYDSVEEAAKSF